MNKAPKLIAVFLHYSALFLYTGLLTSCSASLDAGRQVSLEEQTESSKNQSADGSVNNTPWAQVQDSVFYAGNEGKETFYDVVQLSDRSFLTSGYADNLDWIPAGAKRINLSSGPLKNGSGTGKFGFILRLSPDLKEILSVASFAKGAVEDIRYIKLTNQPGQATQHIYISGNTSDSRSNKGGYFIAKLNGNYVDREPSDVSWAYPVWAEGSLKSYQPWDVGHDGRVVFIVGQAHAADWASAEVLDADGKHLVMENWRTHKDKSDKEVYGSASENGGAANLSYSMISFKFQGRGDLRSWTSADYNLIAPDGNGGTKQGKWPFDVFFNGPWDKGTRPTSGPGYTGYRASSTPVAGPSAVVVDRRNGDFYIGMNAKSVLPDGNPDFEPAVIAYDATGALKWWSRLYHEVGPDGVKRNSSPDQYIDYLAIDYSKPQTEASLVVLARCRGNNTENFWEGNTIHSKPHASGFQNSFSGNQGNIHISYLAKLQLTNGVLQASTYLGEYADEMKGAGTPFADPLLDAWPNPNTGWPDLNTTRVRDLNVMADGSVVVSAVGRRTMTTKNAYQKDIKPAEGKGTWADFVRVYTPDLSRVTYSTLLTGAWNIRDGKGGGNTELFGVAPSDLGLVVVGRHNAGNGTAIGNAIPVTNPPSWGQSNPQNESSIFAVFSTTQSL